MTALDRTRLTGRLYLRAACGIDRRRIVLAAGGGQSLAKALDGLIAMYGPHAAREDTDLFPAWKKALGPSAG